MSKNCPANAIQAYLKKQAALDTLRFITCGSVDDGKSTLIGRMLFEAQSLADDQIAELKALSKKHGTQGDAIDFALLVDGLEAERSQGITIDVAYRFFATDRRKFIVADTPGHAQYTRNMATGASTASLAIILIDARHGIMEQTRRHSIICNLMGIRQIILAVNKMDLVGYDQDAFAACTQAYTDFAADLDFTDITPIALSALKGDNIISRAPHMPWYQGPTLISKLETAEHDGGKQETHEKNTFAMPVQWVNRSDSEFRGFSGMLLRHPVKQGDSVRVVPSGATSTVKNIWRAGERLAHAAPGLSVTLELDDAIDISRGDVLVSSSATGPATASSATAPPVDTANQFEANLIWLSQQQGHAGRNYVLKLATQTVSASISSLKHQLDVNSGQDLSITALTLNAIVRVTLNCQHPIAFAPYQNTRDLGAFILIDPITFETVAAGMICFALRRTANIHKQPLAIGRQERQALNGHAAKVFWFTGLSGAGKSTLANAFAQDLHAQNIRHYVLDGDNIRHGLNKDLGFTDADRVENIRRIAEVARLMLDAGLVVLVAFISPFRAERTMARELFDKGDFIEVFIDTPLEVCERRDAKGLYKKARSGQIPNFTGIDSPYEAPLDPEVRIKEAPIESQVKILKKHL